MDPSGTIEILKPYPGFSVERLPDDWTLESGGHVGTEQIATIDTQGGPVLRIRSSRAAFRLVRWIDSNLLVSPYLGWSWAMDWQGRGRHPMQLIVGFRTGVAESASGAGNQAENQTSRSFFWFGTGLPDHQRKLLIAWGESALERGDFFIPLETGTPRFTIRGGREQSRTWFSETVDLSDLFARAWPGDDRGKARVVFVGIAVDGSDPPVAGYLSGLTLTR